MSILDLLSDNTPVPVMEYKGTQIFVRYMDEDVEDAWDAWVAAMPDGTSNRTFRSNLVARMACDSAGQRLWKDEDAARIAKIPGPRLNKLFNAAWKLHRGEIEEAKKDSAPEGAGGN